MSPKTKAPAPSRKLKDSRAEALQRMTKAELLKTVRTLDARVTKLLNRISELEAQREPSLPETADEAANSNAAKMPNPFDADANKPAPFPWERS